MYVFGGYDNMGMSNNDVHEWSFASNTWKRLNPKGNLPADTYMHTAVVFSEYSSNNDLITDM